MVLGPVQRLWVRSESTCARDRGREKRCNDLSEICSWRHFSRSHRLCSLGVLTHSTLSRHLDQFLSQCVSRARNAPDRVPPLCHWFCVDVDVRASLIVIGGC